LISRHRALYAAFDRFPSRKGAAVHIDRFARALFAHAGGGLLYVLGGEGLPPYQLEGGGTVEIVRFERAMPNFLQRALAYRVRLAALLDRVGGALEICHFRDPWGGLPIVERRHGYATVYEVNGLPSIELPFAFPGISPQTLRKVRSDEERCWNAADVVVVPAGTIRASLIRLGCPPGKIVVVPNGADVGLDASPAAGGARPEGAPARYLLYFGALQPWQGIDTLLRAFARLLDYPDLGLVVCASRESREQRRYLRLASKLGVADRIVWRFALPPAELAPWRAHALLSVAPLTECARNLEQGCAPLKVLESMADGVPVVASDLPAVREIVTDGADGRLVPPDRPAELARAIRLLVDYPDERAALGRAARRTIQRRFTWERSLDQLDGVYRGLTSRRMAC
jgi:glycosyltransferase involved in cell wall biosynthesis